MNAERPKEHEHDPVAKVETGTQTITEDQQRQFLKDKNPGVPQSEADKTKEFTLTRHADR